MKRFRFLALVVAIMTICSTIAFVGCKNEELTQEEDKIQQEVTSPDKALVTLDINPSIEMVVDSNNKVVSIAAKNEDAQIMLCGEEGIVNASVETATAKIVELAIEYGYITDDNSGISMSVAGETTELEDSVKTKITTAIGNVRSSVNISVSTDIPFSVERKWEEWKQNNPEYAGVTASKFALALNACAYDASLDLESAVAMDNGELIEICESGEDKISVYATAAYQAVYDSASVAFNLARDNAKYDIFMLKYHTFMTTRDEGDKLETIANSSLLVGKLSSCITVQYALESMIWAAEKIGELEINATIAPHIADTLGVELSQLQNQEGKVTVESIDAYCDKLIKNASEDTKQAVLAKLDQIKEELSAAEEQAKQDLMDDRASAYGKLKNIVQVYASRLEGFDLTKLTDVDSYKALLAEIIKTKEQTIATMEGNLTEQEKADIVAAQADFEDSINRAQAEFNTKIEEAKEDAIAYLQAKQQERKAALAK